MTDTGKRATPGEIRKFFGEPTVSMSELKALKTDPKDYDDIANGIGNGTLTY